MFSPRDFIQVNDGVNQQMVRTALEWLDLRPEDRVLDLFCGMGNFTLPLATRAAHVVGVEGVPALVEKGRKTPPAMVYQMSLSSMKIWKKTSPVRPGRSTALIKCCWTRPAPAPGVMPHIIKLAPRRVVYVSCNPATLARDSETLLQAGYQIQRLAMLDMFPHTGHLESMVLFERRLTRSFTTSQKSHPGHEC
nr:hypothetical protein [Klebsiella pneumoniae subsp. pneumoniae]